MDTDGFNFGKLRGETVPQQNIVYNRGNPNELSLNITNACPNACIYCIRDRRYGWSETNLYLDNDPSVSDISRAFDKAAAGLELKKVKICGFGEPILRFEDLFPIASHIRRGNPSTLVQVTTTGWPYYKYISSDSSRLKDLKAAGMTDVYLSLTTLDKEKYRLLVRPGIDNPVMYAFDDSIDFARASRDAGLDVTLGFMKILGSDEQTIASFAKNLGMSYRLRAYEK
jgi:TatD family-associated radical SAM protein